MRTIIGMLLVLGGVVFGVWAGVWWALIGGIIDVINQVRAEHLDAIAVAIGVAKIMFAGAIGYAAMFLLAVPGWALVMGGSRW